MFCGHAHRNIEFRLEKEWVSTDKRHEIGIFSDVYSQLWHAGRIGGTWEDFRPVIVQTASCGLNGKYAPRPPYYRKISMYGEGHITDFRVRDKKGVVDFKNALDL